MSNLLNLSRGVLLPKMCSVLMNVLRVLEKNVCSIIVGWNKVCQLDPVDWWCCSAQFYLYRFPPCWIYYWNKGIETANWDSGFIYFSLQFCPTYFDDLLSRAYILRTVVSSGRIDPLIIKYCFCLPLIIFLALMSALSDTNIATSAFLWCISMV